MHILLVRQSLALATIEFYCLESRMTNIQDMSQGNRNYRNYPSDRFQIIDIVIHNMFRFAGIYIQVIG